MPAYERNSRQVARNNALYCLQSIRVTIMKLLPLRVIPCCSSNSRIIYKISNQYNMNGYSCEIVKTHRWSVIIELEPTPIPWDKSHL